MFFLLRIGNRSLVGHVFYGVRSALLVGTALLMAPLFLDVAPAPERAASRPEPPPSATDKLTGRVTRVRDGDTVEISDIPVRISNLDCPEHGTDAGWRATQQMYRLARDGPFSCRLSGRRSHDREIGTCRLPDGRDLGRAMISQGVCRPWR
jgi:endonuclease YncB( thermonuclease family)